MPVTPLQPGDVLLDRYLPAADDATREAARGQWKALVQALLKVAMRLTTEEVGQPPDSPKGQGRLRIPSLP